MDGVERGGGSKPGGANFFSSQLKRFHSDPMGPHPIQSSGSATDIRGRFITGDLSAGSRSRGYKFHLVS